jgi:hypothetical protein
MAGQRRAAAAAAKRGRSVVELPAGWVGGGCNRVEGRGGCERWRRVGREIEGGVGAEGGDVRLQRCETVVSGCKCVCVCCCERAFGGWHSDEETHGVCFGFGWGRRVADCIV